MPRIVHYYVATTVDGFIARSDGSFDCFPTEGEHVAAYLASLGEFDTVLMGRKTYEVGLRFGVVDPYPSLKAFVYSRTLEPPPHPNVQLVREGAVDHVRQLRDAPGIERLYSGVTNSTPSTPAIACLKRRATSGKSAS